jgi:hypothetical protein
MHTQTQTPPLSPPLDFTRAFAPPATSTQQQRRSSSQREIFGLEACGSGVFGRERDVDVVPVVEADSVVEMDVDVGKSEKGLGLGPGLGRAVQVSTDMMPAADEHV